MTDQQPIEHLLQNLLEKANEFKAADLRAIQVSDLCAFADYFVFMSGTSSTHIKSIAEHLLVDMKKHNVQALSIEGLQTGEWCLLDFGDVIVHIFNQEKRDYYALEELWHDGKVVYPIASD